MPGPATCSSLPPSGTTSIPGSWHIAKRRYLERCVDLYGDALATAGIHTNLSLPDPLFAWDFVHLSPSERGDRHLDEYKSEFYITATRLLRAFAALFIAASAATPFQAQVVDGQPVIKLTPFDSVRNLTFPNPPALDEPNLYRSYADYLQISYDLVRRGVRFGNNNWTPVRARSFAEPVERLIAVTSEQLGDLYSRGLYALGEPQPEEEMARLIENQNLMARINLPMARVEIRTDDGGHSMEVEIANLTLKELLLARFYADPEFGRAFRYDREDIALARRNEELAARCGLGAEIENPLHRQAGGHARFPALDAGRSAPAGRSPRAVAGPAAAGRDGPGRSQHRRAPCAGACWQSRAGTVEASLDLLRSLAQERQAQVLEDVETIAESHASLSLDAGRLAEFLQHARDDVRHDPQSPVRFRPRPEALVELAFPDKTSEIVALAQALVRIPSVTACPQERLDEVHRAGTFLFDYARNHGLGVRYFDKDRYPALLVGFPEQMHGPGHAERAFRRGRARARRDAVRAAPGGRLPVGRAARRI